MLIKTIQDYENLCRLYVFRGQSNKDWDLLPGVYRKDSNIIFPVSEKLYVDEFFRSLKKNGYRDFPSELNQVDFLTKPAEIFPTEELLPYWAIAQHYAFDSQLHCLKTSLLDVTHNLDIAAYFAVEDVKEWAADGLVFVFDPSTLKEPYKFYEPSGGYRLEARLVVQECAFIYREQTIKNDHMPYTNKDHFDDIVKERIIIPCDLKPLLKEYLQKKLFDLFMYPRLILGSVTPNLATAGRHTVEELKAMHKQEVDRAERLGDKHSDY
jgi:hypothetical protein